MKGFSFYSEPVPVTVSEEPRWYAKLRRTTWGPNFWLTVRNSQGDPVAYTTPQLAIDAAHAAARNLMRGQS